MIQSSKNLMQKSSDKYQYNRVDKKADTNELMPLQSVYTDKNRLIESSSSVDELPIAAKRDSALQNHHKVQLTKLTKNKQG